MRARLLTVVGCTTLALAGCGGTRHSADTASAPGLVRAPDARTSMDENAANLASAVVTYNFGQLPKYIDHAKYRLLPHDLNQAVEPRTTSRKAYRLVVPHTSLVLDTVVTSALTESQAREDASYWRVAVRIDGRPLVRPERFWVFYRNNGAQICRIYFPGDLGALNMGVHSLVLRLPPGRHSVHVTATRSLGHGRSGRLVADYALRVLARAPNVSEVASAPDDLAGDRANVNRTPLTFRSPTK